MKVIICGPRDLWLTVGEMEYVVQCSGFNVSSIVEGGAKGVDRSARNYAKIKSIPFSTINARWDYWRSRGNVVYAGRERNYRMAHFEEADACIAVIRKNVPISGGTGHSIAENVRAGNKVCIKEV